MRASTNAHTARARGPQKRTVSSSPSNPMRPSVLARARPPGPAGGVAARGEADSSGPRSAGAQLRGPEQIDRCQAFLAGTAVGSAGLAVRARLVRALLTGAVAL